MTIGYAPSSTNERSGEDGWHEWSLDLGTDQDPQFKPRRLFVRVDVGGLIEITDARVTSGKPTARELEDDNTRKCLIIIPEDARWLAAVLLVAAERVRPAEETVET